MCSSDLTFQPLVEHLLDRWQVLLPDWRGFGYSEWPQDGYWFQDYVGDFEAGGFGRGASCVSQRGVADADTSLANAARQERHHDFDFLGVKFVEKARQEVYFSEALGGFRYAPGRLYYGRQQHVRRIAEMVWLLRAGAYCR